MPAARFQMRPVIIEAVQWDGHNGVDLDDFTQGRFEVLDFPLDGYPLVTARLFDDRHRTWALVHTHDWIVKGMVRELFPCRDSVFRETYKPA